MDEKDAAPANRTSNDLSGSVANAVQAGTISGGVHIHSSEPRPIRPHQLPPLSTHFTGRDGDLDNLNSILESWSRESGPTVIVSAVAGAGGIGKTALAVHWAHSVAHRFPDGVLYVNLQGYGPESELSPHQALHGFLLALGCPPDRIPQDLDARTALLRTLLHDRRVLLLLDNARNAQQVRPLLPSASKCFVLVTSRSQLSSLVVNDGAHRIMLDMLAPEDSIELLASVLGRARVDAEPEAARLLADRCGRLPLALRIASELAAGRPHTSLDELARELQGGDRLDALATYDDDETSAVRATFSWSYVSLSTATARAFRLLSLPSGPDISLKAAAALVGLTLPQAQRIVSGLVSANLLEIAGHERFRFHDLIRDYARERAFEEDEEADRDAALGRLFSWMLATAQRAGTTIGVRRGVVPFTLAETELPPADLAVHFDSPASAIAWCEAEFEGLLWAGHRASKSGDLLTAWRLPIALRAFFQLRRPTAEWILADEQALSAAELIRDDHAQLAALRDLGAAYAYSGRPEESYECAVRALELSKHITEDEGWCLNSLGAALVSLRRFDEAVPYLVAARRAGRDTEDLWLTAHALENIAPAQEALGRFEEAVTSLEQALSHFRTLSYPFGQGLVLGKLAAVYISMGRLDDAVATGLDASSLHRAVGNRLGEVSTLNLLARASDGRGLHREAFDLRSRALRVLEELNHPDAADLRATLASAAGEIS